MILKTRSLFLFKYLVQKKIGTWTWWSTHKYSKRPENLNLCLLILVSVKCEWQKVLKQGWDNIWDGRRAKVNVIKHGRGLAKGTEKNYEAEDRRNEWWLKMRVLKRKMCRCVAKYFDFKILTKQLSVSTLYVERVFASFAKEEAICERKTNVITWNS